MDNPLTRFIDKRRDAKTQRDTKRLVDEIDTIARLGINRAISSKDNTPAITRNVQSKLGTAITGKLKKRYAPNRDITTGGIHINKFNMSDIYNTYVGENLMKLSGDKYSKATTRNG